MSEPKTLEPCPFCGEQEFDSVGEGGFVTCGWCGADGPCTNTGNTERAQMLWNTRTLARERWVPVGEGCEMPVIAEEGGSCSIDVLVTVEEPDGTLWVSEAFYSRHKEEWISGGAHFLGHVLAWQPLPEPFRGDGGGESPE